VAGKKIIWSGKSKNVWLLALVPVFGALAVWFSPLSFVPTPWPDDSAFYFVAKEFFRWPPRWVMLPQAPFEPTYRIFNFNTMPLYPMLLGIGRWLGIDGSFLLKIWPLGAWAACGSLLVVTLYRLGLPFLGSLLLAFGFTLDPALRWSSVLIRPESLIGLFGMSLVLGLTYGFPERFRPRRFWDPVAVLLACGAYAHFNSVHLVWPVLFTFAFQPRRVLAIGFKTILYLSPWLFAVMIHFDLFIQQMKTQWERLNVPNHWLYSFSSATSNLFQTMGTPEPWPSILNDSGSVIWVIILIGFLMTFSVPLRQWIRKEWNLSSSIKTRASLYSLAPSIAWVIASIWLFSSKPESWFVHYIHLAFWCFTGVGALHIWKSKVVYRKLILVPLFLGILGMTTVFGYVDLTQAIRLGETSTWNWATYDDFVACVDYQLVQLEKSLGPNKPFRVWCPTPPDITIELSTRHPSWELTRTNDFYSRYDLAVQHGWDTEAVVVTETINYEERNISEKPQDVPWIISTWMVWKDYFLIRLLNSPGWKPNRFICQRGRWQAFLYMVNPGNGF
jgi:hypothetical protein